MTLKSIGVSCTLNGSLTCAWLCNIILWSFGKYHVTALCSSYKCSHILLYNIKTSHLFILLPISSEKSLSIGNLLSSQCRIQISKIPIFTWKLAFYPWQRYCQLFSLKLTVHFIFNKMSAKDPNLNKHALPASCSFK